MAMKILIPIDGSYHSEFAADSVIERPWPPGTTFEVMTVVEPMYKRADAVFGTLGSMAASAQVAFDADVSKVLHETEDKFVKKFGAASVRAEMIQAPHVAKHIIETAVNGAFDLIVMGDHGAGGWDDEGSDSLIGMALGTGSVTDIVVKNAHCSVEIMRELDGYTMQKKEKEKRDENKISRYLLPVDHSNNSKLIIEHVLERPWPDGSFFQVLHVVQRQVRSKRSRHFQDPAIAEAEKKTHDLKMKEAETLVKNYADKIAQKLGKDKVSFHAIDGNVRATIVQIAQDWPADFILIGAHEPDDHLVADFFFGTVAQAVINNARCSIEIVRPSDS